MGMTATLSSRRFQSTQTEVTVDNIEGNKITLHIQGSRPCVCVYLILDGASSHDMLTYEKNGQQYEVKLQMFGHVMRA